MLENLKKMNIKNANLGRNQVKSAGMTRRKSSKNHWHDQVKDIWRRRKIADKLTEEIVEENCAKLIVLLQLALLCQNEY
jgi:hypothetical protein